MIETARYLLVISCSKRKNKSENLLPAIERYTGAWYGVINKLKRENRYPPNLDIVIISAKYGFLEPNDPIENYDLRMTEKRAKELNHEIISKFKTLLESTHYNTIYINLGKDYLPAIDGLKDIISQNSKIRYAKGRVGERKSQMKKFILSVEK